MSKEVKNFIKNPKKITAPLNFQSSPDSPATTLAYVTKPEIDMLIKANIHGSMNDGMPNRGPMGIMSLDGGGSYAEETKTDTNKKGSSTGASQVQSTSQSGGPAGMTFTESVSNPYIGVTQEEAQQQQQQIQNQPNQASDTPGGIQTLQEEEEEKSNAFTDFVDDLKGMGGINPVGVLFGKGMDLLTKPQKADFLDEKNLAAMALNLQGKTEKEQQEFFDTYRDVFSDAFKDEIDQFEEDQGFSVNPDDLLKQKFNTALKKSQSGALGKGSQTVTNPEEAYKDTIAVTTSQQVDLARLDPKKYPKLADKIFQARMDLNQKDVNPFTGNKNDQGGIPSVNTGGGSQADADTDTTDPGFPDNRFRDLGIAPFASYNPDDVMVDFSNYQATRGPLSSITNAKDGGIMKAADGAMVSISMTPLPITNIQEIKMDKQKYRDNMIREEIARSSMRKDLDLAPNFSMDA